MRRAGCGGNAMTSTASKERCGSGAMSEPEVTIHGSRAHFTSRLPWHFSAAFRDQLSVDSRLVLVDASDGNNANAGRLDDVDGLDAKAGTELALRRSFVPRHVDRDDGRDDAAVPGSDVVALP
jgi:hypothetical protein